jgi:hypothetical protein
MTDPETSFSAVKPGTCWLYRPAKAAGRLQRARAWGRGPCSAEFQAWPEANPVLFSEIHRPSISAATDNGRMNAVLNPPPCHPIRELPDDLISQIVHDLRTHIPSGVLQGYSEPSMPIGASGE